MLFIVLEVDISLMNVLLTSLLLLEHEESAMSERSFWGSWIWYALSDELRYMFCGRNTNWIYIGNILSYSCKILFGNYYIFNRSFVFLKSEFWNKSKKKMKAKIESSLKIHLQKSCLPNISSLALAEKSILFLNIYLRLYY